MIWPSASVIMMKPMPVARSASAANTAVDNRPTTSAARIATRVAEAGGQHVAGGIGRDAEQAGMAERHQAGITDQNVQAQREDGVEQDLARHVDVIDAAHPLRHCRQQQRTRRRARCGALHDHGTCLPNRPCGRKISTSSIGRNSTK